MVRSNGSSPQVSIEWAGGTGPQGIRAVCACGGSGVCAHVVATLEAVRTHVDAYEEEQTHDDGELDWLPPPVPPAASRARKIWPVFFSPDGVTLACSLFLDTPRLRGVLREGDAIATMLDQTPPDDWDEHDRSLVRDALLRDAFAARPNVRALAQIMFRLARHPRVRFDEAPNEHRHPEELSGFTIDARGVRLGARMAGARAVPKLETSEGREIDLKAAVVIDGPPAWIADNHGAYLLDGTLDAARAARAVAAAKTSPAETNGAVPSIETLARVAPYLGADERRKYGIEDARDVVGRLRVAWRDGVLLVNPQLRDRASGAVANASAGGAIVNAGSKLVRFPPESGRELLDRLATAGCVPRLDTDAPAFGLHGADRAAEFVRETLPGWSDLEIELEPALRSLDAPQHLGLSVGARRSASQEDWFDLDVGVWLDEGEPLSREELSAILAGSGSYADVRGRLVDVSGLRARDELLHDLLDRKQTGLAALVALRDEIHAAFGNVRLPEEVEALRERVRDFGGVVHVPPPGKLDGVLRHYQERGLDFLGYLGDFRFGGILADDMGLGKTISTLAYLLHRKQRDGQAPSLVIAPTSVTHTWANEIAKFTPELSLLQLESGNGRAARYEDIGDYDVVVTSYTLARLDAEKLARTRFRAIVLDEAQNAKNPASQISKVVRTLRAEHRLALTGTPVENSLRDLWAIFAFLEPGLLGTEGSFRRRFEVPISGGDTKAIATLHARLEPFVLRRTKEDVTPELPERTESEIFVDLSPAQLRLYRAIAAAARRELVEVWDEGSERTTIHVLAALTRLRQVCAHPGLLSKQYVGQPDSSSKFETLLETVDEIVAGGHKVLVFSSFASMLRLVRDELERRKMGFGYLDGSVKEKDRRSQVAAFMSDGGPPVFLCSLKAGGVGLTLTAADYVILYDPWWNPAAERQAIDRTHRIGQRHAVTAYRLLARGTVEEKIRALAGRKRELSETVVRADAAMAKALTREDLEFLFSEPE